MRSPFLSLGAVLLLAGCSYLQALWPGDAGGSGADMQPEPAARSADASHTEVDRWQAEWARSKREVAEARTQAEASGRDIAPEVEAEVTELLDRDVSASSDAERLRRLQDAVSDARRLAELVSAG